MTQPAPPAPQAGPPQGQPTQPTQPTQPPAVPAAPAQSAPPPWGDDANFDPARAWQLLQNRQADLDRVKAQNAELKKYEDQVKAAEDAAKTELQRAQEAAAQSKKDADEARLALLKHQVANREGKVLPPELANRLVGSTQAELEADADKLLAALPQPPTAPVAPAGTTPVAALRPTTMPNPPAPDLATLIAEAKAKGDIKTVIALENSKLANYQPNA